MGNDQRKTATGPRTGRARAAATRDLLAAHGYAGTSLTAVAQAAGITRPTVYLRWASKEDLVIAAVATMPVPLPLPVTDDPRSDLLAELHHFHVAVTRPNGMSLIGTVLAEEQRTPALLGNFRDRLLAHRRSRVEHILRRGVEAGLLPAGFDVEVAVNALIGSFYARYLAESKVPTNWPDRVVDVLWPI